MPGRLPIRFVLKFQKSFSLVPIYEISMKSVNDNIDKASFRGIEPGLGQRSFAAGNHAGAH
jgi:hypothetical protein